MYRQAVSWWRMRLDVCTVSRYRVTAASRALACHGGHSRQGALEEPHVTTGQETPLMTIAGATAENLIFSGYAPSFGDDKVEALAETLSAFLKAAGIPVDEAASAAHFAELHDREVVLAARAKTHPFTDDGE
jgi:hypothetical protein